jgi:tetratricopeptide (TPR) repeat protein
VNGHPKGLAPSDQICGSAADDVLDLQPPVTTLTRPRRAVRAPVIPQPADLVRIRSLHEAGRNREALAAALEIGPLERWVGTQARLLAGDLADSLGAPRLGASLHLRAWRRARSDYEAMAAGLSVVLERSGVWALWERLRPLNLPEGKQANPAVHRLWLLRAYAAAVFRDFEAADGFWQRAEKIAPRAQGLHVARAVLLEREDRFEEGLASARRAAELCTSHVGAVARSAHLLQKLERDEEALALLRSATARLESVPLLMQLAGLQSALELHREGLETLDRIRAVSTILEKGTRQWVLGLRCQLAWRCGDAPMAVAAARELGDPASLEFAARAEAAGSNRRRVQLNVPFVAQHHDTCAPATMAALGKFWIRPIDQLQAAEEITYGGTSAVHQRRWLEQNGWVTRPFTVTWEAACALLDRGVPFELFTYDATCGHAQAVCGYDAVQQTLLVRDPNFRHVRRLAAEPFLNSQRATGPTGWVLVPVEQTALLEGVTFPDGRLHELQHQLLDALDRHDRDAARAAAASMEGEAPGHWLTLRARLTLARYDGNTPLALECLDRLLEKFPGDTRLLLEKLADLAEQERREERVELLARACGQPHAHPLLFLQAAQELCQDAREHAAATAWVRRAMRSGELGGGLACLAGLLWQAGRFEEALEIRRFCTCLTVTREDAARHYFAAARHLNQTEQALEFLHHRFERFGRKSPEVAVSLCIVLHTLGRHQEAREVLESAQRLLPEDASLEFYAAEAALQASQPEQAEGHLRRAQGRVLPGNWRRLAARIAEQRGDLPAALDTWREIASTEPHSAEAQAAIAQLLAETEGRPAALRHLEEICARFPWHFRLHKVWFSWQQDEDLLSAEPIADRLLALNPRDAEAHRQKARILTARGKFDDALKAAAIAVGLDPTHPQGHAGRGRVFLRQGQLPAAQEAFRRAVSLAVDSGEFMAGLLECCRTAFDRRLALDFIRNELVNRLVYGEGILAFCGLAGGHLPPPELLKFLRQLTVQRPELWQVWAALIRELAAQGELREALKVVQTAVVQLPDSAPLWGEIAAVQRRCESGPAEIEAREKVLALSAGNPDALCRLADALDRLGQPDRAKGLLEEALRLQPRMSFARLLLSKVFWSRQQRDEAVEQLKQALRFAPGFEQAWGILGAWGRILERPTLVLDLAQELVQQRPSDPAVWLRLARLHLATGDNDRSLTAVEKALTLHPRSLDANDLRVSILIRAERLDEALAACRAEAWGATPPPLLQAREANILYARGEREAAFSALYAVVEQTPTLLWGWRLLGSWHLTAGERAEAETIASRLLEFGSRDADSYFWVAQMKLAANDTPEGVEMLERALELDPGHLPARVRLMYVQLATNQFNALQETLRQLAWHGATDWVCVAQASLALRKNDLATAFDRLGRLCDMPGAEERAIVNTARAIRDHGAAALLEKVLRERLAKPAPRAIFGSLWVEAWRKQGRLPRGAELLARCQGAGVRRPAIHAWLEAVQSLPASRFPFRWFARKKLLGDLGQFQRAEGEWLRKDTAAWGWFGLALIVLRSYRAAGQWYADWRQRPRLPSWTLHNITNALVCLGRYAEAIDAGRAALSESSGEQPFETVLTLAWLEANTGQSEEAHKRVAKMKPEQLDNGWRTCSELINAAIRVGRAPAAQKHDAARSEYRQLRAVRNWRGMCRWEPVFRRLFRDSIRFLAANGAPWHARTWARRMTWRWPWTDGR